MVRSLRSSLCSALSENGYLGRRWLTIAHQRSVAHSPDDWLKERGTVRAALRSEQVLMPFGRQPVNDVLDVLRGVP